MHLLVYMRQKGEKKKHCSSQRRSELTSCCGMTLRTDLNNSLLHYITHKSRSSSRPSSDLLLVFSISFITLNTHHLVADVKHISVNSLHLITVLHFCILYTLLVVDYGWTLVYDIRLAHHNFTFAFSELIA